MAAEFNRARLARIFLLPENADDAKLAAAIRRQARKFRKMGRPFVLPRDLDLAGCFAALERRAAYEVSLSDQMEDRLAEARRKNDEKQRQLNLRLLCLNIIRQARDAPEKPGTDA